MTDPPLQSTIASLFESGHKLVYEFTGAGSLALAWLHSVGGSSRLLLEASDRYSPESLRELIGQSPAKAVSRETAALMAERAYRRAVRLSDGASPCIGLACTATIATDRTKRGEHACHVAIRDRRGLTDYGIVLTKGDRDRLGEETVIATLILRALAIACDVPPPELELLRDEKVIVEEVDAPDPIHALLGDRAGRARLLPSRLPNDADSSDGSAGASPSHGTNCVTAHPNRKMTVNESFVGAILSGSFNPLHCGHETMLRAAGKFLNCPTAYELPVVNADKPALSPHEIQRRIEQFRRLPVILTRVPLFSQKAELFPGCTFVVGYDTATRLVDPRYYEGEAGRDAALDRVRTNGCKFLVAARPMPGDAVRTLADVAMPRGFAEMFIELPRTEFLLDLSSTELRGGT